MKKDWWKQAVVYQIYPRSFLDTNHDGIGDIPGIIQSLPYLKTLGIQVIWLSPVYQSPNDDNGYDISDYRVIMKEFGTIQDMETLIKQAKDMGIYIVMDLVVNHTSDEHRWFQEARKSKDNPYRNYYIWRDPVDGKAPNELMSSFGGSAWTFDETTGQYYLHLFSKKQPDLNWDHPPLRQEIYDMMNFWIDKGIGGFRMDVIELIGKQPDQMIKENGPKLHTYIKEMNQKTFGKANLLTVGETWQATCENAGLYSNPDGSELSMIFQFEHMKLDKVPKTPKWDVIALDPAKLKAVMSKWQTALEGRGWNSLFWNNHDLPRIVSRWGNDQKYRVQSAKMFAILLHGMKGTPYIYQGEEIGMTNIKFDSIDDYKDIETHNMYKERLQAGYDEEAIMKSIYAMGRDNARTPMQWNKQAYAGFSDVTPWIQVNANYTNINVEVALQDPASIFYTYQSLINLRKTYAVFYEGSYTLLESDDQIFAYQRDCEDEHLMVICNISDQPHSVDISIPNEATLLQHNEMSQTTIWNPYEARMYYWKTNRK